MVAFPFIVSYLIIDNLLAFCFISTKTVRVHIKSIYSKLQVHSKGEAVVKAIKG